ncbi:uncharacterized protein LOC127846991 [Dreissena polymorpha]|nr:uncharacterized protein LOC127846991 [Dreissena polymorpha]
MKTNILLTLALVICLNAGYCAAVKCYSCSGCGDPFGKNANTLTDNCIQCKKTKTELYGVQSVTRECITKNFLNQLFDLALNECKQMDLLSVETTVCYCGTDGCNGGSSLYITMATVLVPLLVLAKHVFK